MKKEVRDKWLAALRGGVYKQKRSSLRGPLSLTNPEIGHCCLGVLLDVVEPDGWHNGSDNTTHKRSSWSRKHQNFNGYISASFAHSLGIPKGVQKKLASMNDRGNNFNVIADAIEQLVPVEDS